jgi:hypothetical protein
METTLLFWISSLILVGLCLCRSEKVSDANGSYDNEIGIIFPKMKEAERIIEKLCYEYGIEYNQDLHNIAKIAFDDENREEFAEKMQDIPLPSSKLHDVLRLTVTCKYKTDTERLCNIFLKNRTIYTKETQEYDRKNMPFEKTNSVEEKRIKEKQRTFWYAVIYEEFIGLG